jgi:hypothetical protein
MNNKIEESMIYNGPARPVIFGSFRNTFAYAGFSLSLNVTYRFKYYFRRASLNYGNGSFGLLAGHGGHGDYSLRWQQPGDELKTQVPSWPVAPVANRDIFYTQSSVLVEKGDHIRLQDLNLSYTLDKVHAKRLPFANLTVFTYVNNIGILWKATKSAVDPDHTLVPLSKSIAFGLRTNF